MAGEKDNLENPDELVEPGDELPRPTETDQEVERRAPAHHPNPQEEKTSLSGILRKLLKRNGRHPADCNCPLHRAADAGSVFGAPVLSDDLPVESSFVAPVVPPNPARFEMWGRLAARAVKSAFKFLTSETPSKAEQVFGTEKGKDLVKDLILEDQELADIESSASRVAAKYNLTTGFDEEIELAVTVGAVFGRVVLVNRKLDKALEERKTQTHTTQ